MQLADNPITKILREKVKNQNFNNLNKFIYEENRTRDFQLCFGDLLVDFTRQPINYDIKKDLLALAKQSNILEKIKQLKKIREIEKLDFDIEIDGGINFDNCKIAIEAGANILVSGTTVFKSNDGDIKKNINLLKRK